MTNRRLQHRVVGKKGREIYYEPPKKGNLLKSGGSGKASAMNIIGEVWRMWKL